jgi:hypothetical protein
MRGSALSAEPAYSADLEIVALFAALGSIISLTPIPHLNAGSVGFMFEQLE